MKIMIVDDAYFVRMKLKGVLSMLDVQVIEAENGEQAVQLFKEENPEIIFMDVVMPKKDGVSALKEIRALSQDVKIVMLTSEGDQGTLLSALEQGANHYVIKPFDDEKVLDLVHNLLK
ncbi:MAG: response regulator [Candidatus Margulisbacteria bacterium]|nr:response regulator [Candidatus Margulisiibacteriota bacterium]